MKSIKQRLIDKELIMEEVDTFHQNDLTQEDFDYLVENETGYTALYLYNHPLLTKEHVDYIVEKAAWFAIFNLSHRFSEENIAYIAENHPEYLKKVFE